MIIQSIYLSPTPLQSPEATPLTALLSTIINTRIKVLRRNAPASVTLQCYIATVRPPGPCAKWQGARILCYTIPCCHDMTDSCGVGIMIRKKSRACTRQARFFRVRDETLLD
ncbi:hypothetical protein FOZG_14882 [Fusarium oxysporum Fo47]|uniref:Uncharacterized protein n=1 Tax=Fusarium oxysporum Fo47 TaxID=660027 RepID=W9JIM8_FUSOX|nr:hypothetical protein FOZG_14882 [Fusarium oxysporum Fo47]